MFGFPKIFDQTFQKVRAPKVSHLDEETQDFFDCNREPHPIFSTSLIIQNIAQHLSVPDLMNNFSLVNKLWHYEARLCLRDMKSCTLAPGRIKYPEDAEAVLMLCTSEVIPFNQISVNYAVHVGEGCWESVSFEPILKLIDAMNLKCIHVQNYKYQFGSDTHVSVAVEKLIAHVLRWKWKTVEEISFGIIEYSYGRFALNEQQIPMFARLGDLVKTQEGFSLRALHSLTFDCRQEVEPLLLFTCVLPILRIAPGLKNLNLEIPQFLLAISTEPVLPQEKLSLLTRLTLDLETHIIGSRTCQSLININIACKRLKLRIPETFICTKEIMQLLPPFFNRSRKSLIALVIDVKTIRVLQNAGLLALTMPNMRYLFLTLSHKRYGAEQIYEMFVGLCKSFPNLRSIILNQDWDSSVCRKAELCDIFRNHSDPATKLERLGWPSVKRLIFHNCYSSKTAEFFSILLPQLSYLGVDRPQQKSEYSRIMSFWPNLESLELVENRPNRLEFEAVMCGISEAKVCELRQISSDQIHQMVIVPIGPTIIAGMPNLRSLRINVVHDLAYAKGLVCPVPHVSECVAYSRKKNLYVCYQYVPSCRRLGDEEKTIY